MNLLNDTENSDSLYKVRDISTALSDTFKYLKQHYKQLVVPLVLIVGPYGRYLATPSYAA